MPRGATAELEPGEQADLFPELNEADPKQKELLRRAKKYHKENSARQEQLKENKAFVDGLREAVVDQMMACKLTKFRYRELTVEAEPGKVNLKVKIQTDDDDEEENTDADNE